MSKNPESKRLFIGSLPFKYSEGELLSLFIAEGKIVAVKIITNRWGRSRGMAYVEFENLDDAIRAKKKFHGHEIGDRSIIVDYALPDPYLTEEGRQRHEEAEAKRMSKRRKPSPVTPVAAPTKSRFSFDRNTKKAPETGFAPRRSDKSKSSSRQSVYDSRTHHSKVGAKFASKTKKKK